ncbi:helix-turn-helix domain-containing protein [Alloalcanivorax xenomutans]
MNSPQEIVRALMDAGETQLSIERATGISQATISRIASGVSQDPRSSTVAKLREYADRVLLGRESAA